MPFWRIPKPYRFHLIILAGVILTYNIFPDPPAVQNADARRSERAEQRRQEASKRKIEERVDKFEQEHPGWLEGTWPGNNSNEGGPNNNRS